MSRPSGIAVTVLDIPDPFPSSHIKPENELARRCYYEKIKLRNEAFTCKIYSTVKNGSLQLDDAEYTALT